MNALRIAPPPRHVRVIASDEEAIETAEWLASAFASGAAARDRDRILPWIELDRFTASGLWGITVPKAQGGAGVSAVTLARVIAIIAAADGSLAQIPQNHFYALEVVRSGGSPAQQALFHGLALTGHRFGNERTVYGSGASRPPTQNGQPVDGRFGRGSRSHICAFMAKGWVRSCMIEAPSP